MYTHIPPFCVVLHESIIYIYATKLCLIFKKKKQIVHCLDEYLLPRAMLATLTFQHSI